MQTEVPFKIKETGPFSATEYVKNYSKTSKTD